MRGRLRVFLFVRVLSFGGLALVLLGGCQADVEVGIEVDESGHGQVGVTAQLDDPAAERIGDLSEIIAADDLREAGWTVRADERAVSVTKRVRSPSDIEVAIAELSGLDGPFADLTFNRATTFARTVVEVAGSVDLSEGVAAFGDDELERLTGSATGIDIPADALRLSLAVDLPGQETSNAPGPGTRWALPIGVVTPVSAESTDVNVLGLVAVAVAVAAGLVLIGAAIRRVLLS